MGYSDLFDLASLPPSRQPRQYGGGVVLESGDPSPHGELHVVPHSGVDLPDDLLRAQSRAGGEALARLAVANQDSGTGRLASRLAQWAAGAGRPVHVAVFQTSRLLLDANRLVVAEQVPGQPYIGTDQLYREYLDRLGPALRDRLLAPWVEGVNELLRRRDVRIVYHHHTFDTHSRGLHSNDKRPFAQRPLGQVFWRKPTPDGKAWVEAGLAGRDTIDEVRAALAEFLEEAREAVPCDEPLLAPALPFVGCTAGPEPTGQPVWHVLYELRKDRVVGQDNVDRWMSTFADLTRRIAHGNGWSAA